MVAEIWDCFFFRDELDLLEARLHELDEHVDRFVLVEGDRTHTGTPKPLVFEENRERFLPWADKIVHIVARLSAEMPSDAWSKGKRPARDRDDEQRTFLSSYLQESAGPDTLIMVSDLDEIPDRDAFGYLRDRSGPPIRLRLGHAIYYANWLMPQPWCTGTLVFRGDQLQERMVRAKLGHTHGDWAGYRELQLEDAGVHISFLGGTDTIRRKFTAYSDAEFNDIRFHGAPHLERCVEYGVHYQGRVELRRLRRDQLTPLLRRLSERPVSSTFFEFRESPLSRFQTRAYCGYTWLRTTRRHVSERSLELVDRHPGFVLRAGAPAFWALDATLRARRRLRPADDWAASAGITTLANPERIVERWR